MKRIINTYSENKKSIQFYMRDIITAFHPSDTNKETLSQFLETEKAAEIIYVVSSDFKQITPNYSREELDDSRVGFDKAFYFKNIEFAADDIYITNPYLHHKTGSPTVTAVKKEGDIFLVIDFDLLRLLEELRLIDSRVLLDKINKLVIGAGGVLLGLVSLFLILYGGVVFITMFFGTLEQDFLQAVFKSIISITIGLAIYDLAKHIIEHEIIFKGGYHNDSVENNILVKFLNSIIIAISIEALMVIFKIVLSDYSQMINALYLIVGLTLLIFARVAMVRFGK